MAVIDPDQELRARRYLIFAEKSLQSLMDKYGKSLIASDISEQASVLLTECDLSRGEKYAVHELRVTRNEHAHAWNQKDLIQRGRLLDKMREGIRALGFYDPDENVLMTTRRQTPPPVADHFPPLGAVPFRKRPKYYPESRRGEITVPWQKRPQYYPNSRAGEITIGRRQGPNFSPPSSSDSARLLQPKREPDCFDCCVVM